MPDRYAPGELAKALRDTHPGEFDGFSDFELLTAIKETHPQVYDLMDPLLRGAEVLMVPDKPQPPAPKLAPPRLGPTGLDTAISTGLRVVPAIAGSFASTEPGVGSAIGAATGAGGEFLGQTYEKVRGLRDSYNKSVMTTEGALNAVPISSFTRNLGRMGRTVAATGMGAGLGASSAGMRTLLEEDRVPTLADVAPAAVLGGAFGGATHVGMEAFQHGLSQVSGMAEGGGLPTGPESPTWTPGVSASHMLTAMELDEASRVTRAGEITRTFTEKGWNIPRDARGSLGRATEAKDYLDEIAALGQAPVAIPPIDPLARPPAPPLGADRLLPETTRRNPAEVIYSYPPDSVVEPLRPGVTVVGGTPAGDNQPLPPTMQTFGEQLEGSLSQPPGPPRLVNHLTLTSPEAAGAPATTAELTQPPLRSQTGAIEQQPVIGGRPATRTQPRLPGTNQPAPLDRTYPEGPNAGPRRAGELHGQPRAWRRQILPGRTYEVVDTPLQAEDPGTYPPEVRRELARMLYELQEHPHERIAGGITRGMLDEFAGDVAAIRQRGASKGGAIAGAPVYHEILKAAKPPGSTRYETGPFAHASRADMIQALRQALLEGRGNGLTDAAAQVARGRLQQEGYSRAGINSAKAHRIWSNPGDGDHLIGWDDGSGRAALPEHELTEYQRAARSADDGELLATRRAWESGEYPEQFKPYIDAASEEAVRRGLIDPDQPGLPMEGPGGDKGVSLLDFEDQPPNKPSTVAQAAAAHTVEQNAQRRGTPDDVPDNPAARRMERERLEASGQPIPDWLRDEPLPDMEGVRTESRDLPPVAEAPFSLTSPPTSTVRTGTEAYPQMSLWDRLKDETGSGVIILDVPAGDRAGLKKWLGKQEAEHGGDAWFSRVEQAIEDGDWDRAWKAAASASARSYTKAYAAAPTPKAERALDQSVRGTPLQADINTQIVGQGRRQAGLGTAPKAGDFPPSQRVTQAGARRSDATLGPAGILNPGPPQRPLEPKYTDHLLGKNLLRTILQETDPDLITLVPGNRDSDLRLFRQVADLAFAGVNTKEVKQFLQLSNEEIAQHYLRSVSEAARMLQQLSAFRQANASTLDELANQMSMGGALRGMIGGDAPPTIVGKRGRVIGRVGQIEPERTVEALAESTRSFDQAMLANTLQRPRKASELELLQAASYPFMISKWATAVRNAVTQAGRYGVDALDEALTIPLAKLLGDEGSADLASALTKERLAAPTRKGSYVTPRTSWKETVQEIYDFTADSLKGLSPDDARQTLKILDQFPTEASHFLGFVGSAGEETGEGASRFKVLNTLLNPKLQRLLTVFNRAQEFTGRGLVFDATMRGQLRAKGLEPNETLLKELPELVQAVGGPQALDELIHNSTAAALEATFAGKLAKGSIPAALVRFVNQAWPLKLGFPFPGFNIARAPRFLWDHGPWALVDLVRFPIDTWTGSAGGGRLTRGIRAQQFETQAIPELVGKRQAAQGRLGSSVRELVATNREWAIRQRQVGRLQQHSNASLPEMQDQLQAAVEARDQLGRRREKAKSAIDLEKRTIKDLQSQEESLMEAVRDAHGIGAPTLPQFFARVGVGTFGLLGSAFVIRSQDGAEGTRWYEYRIPREGKDPMVLDFRPFAPFAQYLFVADVLQDFYHQTDWHAAKQQAGEEGVGGVGTPIEWSKAVWDNYQGKYTSDELGAQFAQAFLSISRAAGTTLTITDLLTQNGWPSLQDAADAIIGTVGQFLSRFTIPAQQLKDVAGAFDPEEAKARITPRATLEHPERPLADPLANVPYVSRVIPERISQTTGKPVATEYPLLRSLAGIGSAPRDFVTEEVRRVGVPGPSVFIRETGDVALDRAIAESYSKILQQELPAVLEDPDYRALGSPALQRDHLQRYVFPALKRAALAEVRDTLGDPEVDQSLVRGEAARRLQRQQQLIDRLEGSTPTVADPLDDVPSAGGAPAPPIQPDPLSLPPAP